MPLIIFVINLGLHTSIVDVDWAKRFLDFRIVKCLSTITDLIKELMPFLDIFTQDVEDMRCFNVPKGLIRLPGHHIRGCCIDLSLYDLIVVAQYVWWHLYNKRLVSLISLACMRLVSLFELLIAISFNTLKPTDDLQLIMELLEPISPSF